jgi:type VI secretion system protein ImpL
MSLHRGQQLPPGVLTFPLEFAALKPALRSFIATLFEDNPYQFPPVFRGFYFTSALQEGAASSRASEHVAKQFALNDRPEHTTAMVVADNGFFLRELFSRVIFADRNLVKQYASRGKLRARAITFAAAVAGLALALGGWTYAYLGNRQLMDNVRADLDKAVKLQQESIDLESRLDALEVLQDRIEQLAGYRDGKPLAIGLGLYQGDAIEAKLREEYFAGVQQVMLQPVAQAVESFLAEVNQSADKLQPLASTPQSAATPLQSASAPVAAQSGATKYREASPQSVEDAYNALKTYLMLADKQRMEPGHLIDQITRFWRGWLEANRGTMRTDKMIGSAERMITFSMANLHDPAFPALQGNLTLVDQTRENLRRVVKGEPALKRVYADIKARASTRFAPMTVARIVGDQDRDVLAGSYAISGTFTREAWDEYVEDAFKEAATKELQSTDWVLKTATSDDLTLEGSPEQIRKKLTDLYKVEYVQEWQRFMQGISVSEFPNFDSAVARMNRLGDPTNSPIKRVMTELFDQTSWDNPSILNERLGRAQRGFVDWFKQTILRQAPSGVEVKVDVSGASREVPMGPIGREFAALSRVMVSRDNSPTQMSAYLGALSKVRTKFNQIKTQGDPGPAARQLMAATLDSGNSELAEALRLVDEQMLVGMTDTARAALRPLLVRPLMQSFAVTVTPAETELNRVWAAQVYEPFQRTLAAKYPFDGSSRVEAAPGGITKIFGPEGAIAKFSNDALGTLVTRRGTSITPRTWAEIGIRLRPEFVSGFDGWVAALDVGGGAGGGASGGGGGAGASAYVFQMLPQGAPGLSEYTISIEGQTLRYRNAAADWTTFTSPGPGGAPGVRITGVTPDGRTLELFSDAGNFALKRMYDAANRRPLGGGVTELTWGAPPSAATVHFKIVSAPSSGGGAQANSAGGASAGAGSGLRGVRLPSLVAGVAAPAATPVASAASGVRP